MQYALVLATIFLSFAVIGYPACLLLPAGQFNARFVAAPTVGFAIFSAASTLLYACGVPLAASLIAFVAWGALTLLAHHCLARPALLWPLTSTTLAVAVATVAIALICILPAWLGGPSFTVFEANAYDKLNAYLPGSVVFHRYSYADVKAALNNPGVNPIVAASNYALMRAAGLVNAAFAGIGGLTTPSASYAYLVALQMNMFFSAMFVAINIFAARFGLAILLSAALTIGFFEQYVFDIDAWSELSTLPVYVLLTAIVALAFDPNRFGADFRLAILRLGALSACLIACVIILYPEAAAVYGTACAVAACVGLAVSRSSRTSAVGCGGIAIGSSIAVAFSYWYGTVDFFIHQMSGQALRYLDWWQYYQAYLLGREADYVGIAFGRFPTSWSRYVDALYSFPVETIISGIGLYFLLPKASWPIALALLWKTILYAFIVLLFGACAMAVGRAWRGHRTSSASRMLCACIAGCVVPLGILIAGRYWSAGKGLSMAAPLLFFLLTSPLLGAKRAGPIVRATCFVFVAAHLLFGILRPISVATDPSGTTIPGLPKSQGAVYGVKAGMDWNIERWAADMRDCKRILLDIDQDFMNKLAQLVATDINETWSAQHLGLLGRKSPNTGYTPAAWGPPDCLVTDHVFRAPPGQRLILVTKDTSVPDFTNAATGTIEIGTEPHPGVKSQGAYAFGEGVSGHLRWLSGDARIEMANGREAPAMTLNLALWDILLTPQKHLRITINGREVFDGRATAMRVSIPLSQFAGDDELIIELKTTPAHQAPPDPRELGVALRYMRLEK